MEWIKQIGGRLSIAAACIGFVGAFVGGFVSYSRVGGDMGFIVALGTATLVGAVCFACGALLGILTLVFGGFSWTTLAGLAANLLGGLIVLWLLWTGGAFESLF